MFDTSAYFGQPGVGTLPFGPQGLFGYPQGQPFTHGQLSYSQGQPGYLQGQLGHFQGQQGLMGQPGLPFWPPFGGQQGHQQIGGLVPPALLAYLAGQYTQSPFGQHQSLFGQQQSPFGQQPYGQLGHQTWPMLGALQGHSPFGGFGSSPSAQGQGLFGQLIGQGLGGWPGQLPFAAQQLGISPFGISPLAQLAQSPFGQAGQGLFGQLGQSPFGQLGQGPFGRTLPIEAALAMAAGCASPQLAGWLAQQHLAATLGRGITPFQLGVPPQPAYAG